MKTLKEKRNSAYYLNSLILHGNNKLLDYTDESGNAFRYAQFNTRPIEDCPFKSAGCSAVCYATKGNHCFPSVKLSRERSYNDSKRADFPSAMAYTIATEKTSARYKSATMLVRLHESGDFYSMQYLRKWLKIWTMTKDIEGLTTVFYTKSFPFFLKLTDAEAGKLNKLMESGKVVMNLSLDDTFTPEQWKAYHAMKKRFPSANTYYCTEHIKQTEHDNVCDCANCAKCGTCNKATGQKTVVKIHSASNADMDTFRANIK